MDVFLLYPALGTGSFHMRDIGFYGYNIGERKHF